MKYVLQSAHMADKIFIDDKPWVFTENDLPCLITYEKNTGGSHFSITMLANLFLTGSKILILTAYPMAVTNFLNQVGNDDSKIAIVASKSEIEKASNVQAIILESGNASLFFDAEKILTDFKERIILIKNVEVFNTAILETCLKMKKIILSGNIDKCSAKNQLIKKKFKTIVAFTQPKISLKINVPMLKKWTAYLSSDLRKGIVSIFGN